MDTISGDDWKRSLASSRSQLNMVLAQIRVKGPKLMIHYTKNEPIGQPAYYTCVFADSKVMLGTIEMEVDGFYYFYPKPIGGFWAAHTLKDIANKLDALNEAWTQRILAEGVKLSGKPIETGSQS